MTSEDMLSIIFAALASPATDSQISRDMATMGWNQSFDKLAESLR